MDTEHECICACTAFLLVRGHLEWEAQMRNQVTCAPALYDAHQHFTYLSRLNGQSSAPPVYNVWPLCSNLTLLPPTPPSVWLLPHTIHPRHPSGCTWEAWQALSSMTSGYTRCTTSSRPGTSGRLITLFTNLGTTQSKTITAHGWRRDMPWSHPWGPSRKLAGSPQGI